MSTDHLIEQLLAEGDASVDGASSELGGSGMRKASFDALRTLLDDSTVEATPEPKSIADASRLLGMATSTLRYYERQGLVRPMRDATGHRRYGPEHMRRLVFCTRMRLSGMSMTDLTTYIRLVDEGDATIEQRRDLMLAHRERIVRRLREFELALAATDYKIATYGGHPHE